MSSRLQILFTGDYFPDYNRTKIIRSGLVRLGHTVLELPFREKNKSNREVIVHAARTCDFIFMPSFTHKEVPFVKKAVPGKIIIFDPLISRYLTKVYDYKLALPFGLSAVRNFFRDKRAMGAADFVVTDTEAHKDYFHRTFHIPKEKMGTLYIGNDFSDYFPQADVQKNKKFLVGFYGGFIPLHGVMVILEAARRLESAGDIEFELIGTGFEYKKVKAFISKNKLKNVRLPGWIEPPLLRKKINAFDLALGIFGSTLKSDLVIPNKVYHYLACARPTITKNSPAIREIFEPQKDIWIIKPDAIALVDAILYLKNNPQMRREMGQRGYEKIRRDFNEIAVAKRLLEFYEKVRNSTTTSKIM